MNKKILMEKNGKETAKIIEEVNKEDNINLNNTSVKTTRDSNIELLRIITMIMIILHHLSLFTNLKYDRPILYSIIVPLGKLGVSIFAIISGYFTINKKFSIKKLLSFYIQVWFFSVTLGWITSLVLPGYEFKPRFFFPVSIGVYWFVNAYIVMYVLSPFINKIMSKLSKNVIKKLIMTMLIISAVAMFTEVRKVVANTFDFIVLYMIGAYIKLYGIDRLKNKKNIDIWFYTMTCWVVLFFIQVITEKCKKFVIYNGNEGAIFNIVTAVFIFYAFKNMNIKKSKFINYLGKCSFAVYLFHEHPTIRYHLWRERFADIGKNNTLLTIIGIVIAIWVFAIILEQIRRLIEKIIFNKKVNERLGKFYNKVDKFFLLEDTGETTKSVNNYSTNTKIGNKS